jgi:hypothetical protein
LTKTPPEFFGADEMKPKNRYAVFDLPERRFQPSSRGKVLRNKVGVTSKTDMDRLEALALENAFDIFLHTYDKGHRFTVSDICGMHRTWLGDI